MWVFNERPGECENCGGEAPLSESIYMHVSWPAKLISNRI